AIIEALGGDIPDAFRVAMGSMDDFGDAGEDAFEDIAGAADNAMEDIEDDIADAGRTFEDAFSDGVDGAMGEIGRLSRHINDTDFSANFGLETAGAFRGLPGYEGKKMATGFEGIIDQPTLALIGESTP
ncbi:unnamed protein product, partial [marine sediment metagenome]